MFDTTEQLIEANKLAIAALGQVLARLHKLLIGALPQENSLLQAQISRTKSQIDLLNIINAHLEAAGVVVKPLNADAKDELFEAFQRVEQAIIQDAIINAGIDTINDVFATVARIGSITQGGA